MRMVRGSGLPQEQNDYGARASGGNEHGPYFTTNYIATDLKYLQCFREQPASLIIIIIYYRATFL